MWASDSPALSLSAGHPNNPSPFPTRYEIRKLTMADMEFASAILCHTNHFHSPLWSPIYQSDMTLFWRLMADGGAQYLTRHQIESGLSYGVFDTQYQYKRAESKAVAGKLYWDKAEENVDGNALLKEMDFPLVSIAMSYDQFAPLDMGKMMSFIGLMPAFGTLYGALAARDTRSPDWNATALGQVLMRNGTSTRADYAGEGLMKLLAHWLMREAKLKGFRAIQIECAHPAVHHVWMHPPVPFVAELVSSVDCGEYEEEGADGVKVMPLAPSTIVCSKLFVTL